MWCVAVQSEMQSTPIQGSAADIIKIAMINIAKTSYRKLEK
jgi:DNA polymerase I-like protein with 3'-5' exonuclease and polymerase domains